MALRHRKGPQALEHQSLLCSAECFPIDPCQINCLRPVYAQRIPVLEGLETRLRACDFKSLEQVRGIMTQHNLRDPDAFERANYIKILPRYSARLTRIRDCILSML
jgi:hypothetical protein